MERVYLKQKDRIFANLNLNEELKFYERSLWKASRGVEAV
jgi:hypothetical protein